MFEELGYKIIPKKPYQVYDIKYYKNDDNVFYFNIKQKTFNKTGEYDGMCNDITMQELQAINEKVKERKNMRKKKIIGVKGFNKDMTCRGMQYEEGKIYKMDGDVKCCDRGYHFCENPIDCLGYYEPSRSIYHKVEALGYVTKDNNDTKIATNEIKIGTRIDFQTMVKMAIDFIYKHCKKGGKNANKRTDNSVASNLGDKSIASNTGYYSVASNLGIKGQVTGKKGTWLVIAEWIYNNDNYEYEIKEVKTVKVDGKKIKEDTYYSLENGKFVEKGVVEEV